MPLYEYQCTECGKRTEVLQRFEDAPLAVCPACGGAVKKMVSSPSFQFKGSGWYVTDYAKKGGADAGRESGGSDQAGGSDGGAAGEPVESSATKPSPASDRSDRAGAGGADSGSAASSKSGAGSEAKTDAGSKSAAKPAAKPAAAGTGSGS
jgi:putative FmdB family regulatory protein